MTDTGSSDAEFIAQWRALPARDRRRIRRLVRLGLPVGQGATQVAANYARFQLRRPWFRLFWHVEQSAWAYLPPYSQHLAAERLRTSVFMLMHKQTWMQMVPSQSGARAMTTVLQIAP